MDKITIIECEVYNCFRIHNDEVPETIQFIFFPLSGQYLMWRHSSITKSYYVCIDIQDIKNAYELYVHPYLNSAACDLIRYETVDVDHDLQTRFETLTNVYTYPSQPWHIREPTVPL